MTSDSKRAKTSSKANTSLPPSLSLFDDNADTATNQLVTAQVGTEFTNIEEQTTPNQIVDLFGEPISSTDLENNKVAEPLPTSPQVSSPKPKSGSLTGLQANGETTLQPIPEMSRSQSLYRKWRSQTFDELVGQEAVTRTLQNAISSGKIGHAYLFCGPRGTGKTSSARLLAKAVNCLEPDVTKRPCNHCDPCRSIAEGRAMDLIEIDAASNRGIDEIRDLRDKINYQPNQLRYKLYIIDEVHMLTEPAFNALLKTLEEPPPHAIFVLATTDPQDIPATVVSRCQRFDFQRIGLDQSVSRLEFVCNQENIQYERAALELVARQSTGSLRDALSLLDQLIVYSDGIIKAETVQTLLGVMNSQAVADFATALINNDISEGLDNINKLVQSGADLKRFNRELVEHLRSLMLFKVNPNAVKSLELAQETIEALQNQSKQIDLTTIMKLLKIFSQVDYNLKVSPYVQLPLEIALMEAILQPQTEQTAVAVKVSVPVSASRPASTQPTATHTTPSIQPKPVNPAEVKSVLQETKTVEPWVEQAPASKEKAETTQEEVAELEFEAVMVAWSKVLEQIRADNKITIHAVLKDAQPTAVNGNRIRLSFKYEFHYKQINSIEKRQYVERHFGQALGQKVLLDCYYEESPKVSSSTPIPETEQPRKKKGYGNLAQTFNARPLDN